MGTCRQHCQLPGSGFQPATKATPYDKGWKYCRLCAGAVKYEGRHCPCCGSHLRHRSRWNRRWATEKCMARY